MLGIFAITSTRNGKLSVTSHLSVFVLLLAIGASGGWITGYAINAARDTAPRLFTALIYGREVWSVGGGYWCVFCFFFVLFVSLMSNGMEVSMMFHLRSLLCRHWTLFFRSHVIPLHAF